LDYSSGAVNFNRFPEKLRVVSRKRRNISMKRLCVFCGSRVGGNPLYIERARELGQALAGRGIGVVYGAGHIGLMGILADAALAAGGEVIGVIPQALVDRELAHSGLTQLHVVTGMHQRKALMAALSDGFVALPGGFGTADETFEMLTWAQLKIHAKPVALLNVAGFFDSLLAWLDRAVQDDLLKQRYRDMVLVDDDLERLLNRMSAAAPRR
jgi:uncharacterized protein (TIGR00730 family)